MSSDLTPEQDAATRQMMLVGDLPARVLGPMREMLKDRGVIVVDSETAESLLERLRQLPSTPPLQPPPLPPVPGLDTEPQPNREQRRRAEKSRRRRGVR